MDGGDLVFLNVKHQDKDKQPIKEPYFEVVRKGEDGKLAPNGETCTYVEGRLKKIESKAREFKTPSGQTETGAEKATFYIQDGNETFAVSINYNIAGRGLFNRILNLNGGENAKISLWRDREGWVVLSLKQNGESVKGKYKKEELPEIKKVKLGKKEISDTAAVDEFFKAKLLEFSATTLSGKKVEKKEETPEGEDSIPF